MTTSRRTRTIAAALLVITGLLNFHIPHFLTESPRHLSTASRALEVILLILLLGAITAAAGVFADKTWAWLLGILVAAAGVSLYVAQETTGLPGLPMNWWEPSRIAAVIVEAAYAALAYHRYRGAPARRQQA